MDKLINLFSYFNLGINEKDLPKFKALAVNLNLPNFNSITQGKCLPDLKNNKLAKYLFIYKNRHFYIINTKEEKALVSDLEMLSGYIQIPKPSSYTPYESYTNTNSYTGTSYTDYYKISIVDVFERYVKNSNIVINLCLVDRQLYSIYENTKDYE